MEKITDQRDGTQQDRAPRVDKSMKRRAIAAEDSEEEGEPSAKKPKFGKSDKGGSWDNKGSRDDKDKKDRKGGKGKREGREGREGRGDKGERTEKAGGDREAAPAVAEKRGLEKLGSQLGSMIGRKRKMRKGGN